MKKLYSIILSVLVIISLCACSSAPAGANVDAAETVSESDAADDTMRALHFMCKNKYQYYWGNSQYAIISSYYPKLSLIGSDKKNYSELDKAITAFNSSMESMVMDKLDENKEAAEFVYSEIKDSGNPDAEFIPYGDKINLYIMRADSVSCAFLKKIKHYSGESHELTNFETANFDTASGKELKLSDVVSDETAFAKLVAEQIEKNYPSLELNEGLDISAVPENGYHWAFAGEGINVYFSEYDLTPEALEIQAVHIPFSGNENIFNEKYTLTMENYFLPIIDDVNNYYDADADGTAEVISIESVERDTTSSTVIHVGENECTDPAAGERPDSYILRSGGKTYIYCFSKLESDYPHLFIAEANANGVEAKTYADYCKAAHMDDDKEMASVMLTDAGSFELGTRMWVLYTYDGVKRYHVSEDGIPVTSDKYFECRVVARLTLKLDVELTEVDIEGNEVGTYDAKKDEALYVYRTDGKYVDLKTADGKIVRLKMQREDAEYKVNGMLETDMFDGIVYM